MQHDKGGAYMGQVGVLAVADRPLYPPLAGYPT